MKTKFKLRKVMVVCGIVIGIMLIVLLLSFIPTLSLKTKGMQELKGQYVTVYYEKEESAAKDVFELAEAESERISKSLGFSSPQGIKMFIYDNQSTFQTKKYGYIALMLNLDWYIGDNIGTNVMLTSPANPGKVHDYDNNKHASIHEMVHAYNSILNRKMPLWIDEGLAGYLSNQKPRENLYSTSYFVPTIKQTHVSSPVEFEKIGGYNFSYTYIEYLDKEYGWDKVIDFAKTFDYKQVFYISEEEIYSGWIEYLKENYS